MQTHGMVVEDARVIIKILDTLLTRPLLTRSANIFYLTEKEFLELKFLSVRTKMTEIPNGISITENPKKLNEKKINKTIVFCSRIHKRKGTEKFIELAEKFNGEGFEYNFEIFGPDGGQLEYVLRRIKEKNLMHHVTYQGPLKLERVIPMLANVACLVLPSKDEPFPMIVIEALSVGTPVLVFPSCGISKTISKCNPDFVAPGEAVNDLAISLEKILKNYDHFSAQQIIDFCQIYFNMTTIGEKVLSSYLEALEN